MVIQNLIKIVSSPDAAPKQITYCTKDFSPYSAFQKYLPANTKVWNSLCHQNGSRK